MEGDYRKTNARHPRRRSGDVDRTPRRRVGSMDDRVDGLAVIAGDEMYHYAECGLDYVWLRNGFEYRDTPRGRLVKINDVNGLHAAIAKWIVINPARLRGQEVRFLRSMLSLSQEGFGKLLRQSRPTIARWEGDKNKIIPQGSDDWLRLVYMKKTEGDAAVCKLMDLLTELDELKNGRQSAREARFNDDKTKGWSESRLAVAA
jgi:DNA-binding transcriptional regulator YiaG